MQNNSENQIPLGTGNNGILNKIPLSQAGNFETTSYVRIFKVDKTLVEKNGGKLWISSEMKTNYQKDEMIPTTFKLYGQSYGAFGVSMDIDEKMLESMLEFVRSEKKKVYCIEGSQ